MLGAMLMLAAFIGLCLRVGRWLDCLPRQGEQRATPIRTGRRAWRLPPSPFAGTF